MQKFWTLTESNTEHTNSRSKRFSSLDEALATASRLVESGKSKEIFVLVAVKVVRHKTQPVEILDTVEMPTVLFDPEEL